MSTSKLIFFIFFHAMYPAALDLLPCEFEQLFGVSLDAAGVAWYSTAA